MPYIHFTQEQKDRAARTDLEVFLRSRGEKLLPSGRDKRLDSDHSVTIRGNHWFDHATHEGGNAISFVQRFYHLGYADAVSLLLCNGQVYEKPAPSPPKKFTLPTANGNMRRVFAYLTQHRCIHREVVSFFAHAHLLYEEAAHHNCVFVGMDEHGEAKHAHFRSTNSQGTVFRINVEGSEAKHSFHKNGTDLSLYVFEAPIDLLSHITLYPAGWLEHSYVACCGTSIQPVLERLRQNPKLNMVYLCLDNDEAGEDACESMTGVLADMDVDVERLRPQGKDWNDDLCAKHDKAKTPTA